MDIRNRTPTNWRNKKNRKTRQSDEHCKMGKRNQQIRLGHYQRNKTIYRIEEMLNIKNHNEINEKANELWQSLIKQKNSSKT